MRISDWSSDVCSSDLLDHLAFRTERRGRGASQPQRAAAPVRSTPYEDWQNTRATARQPPGLSTHPKTGRLKIFRSIYSASRPGEKRSSSHHCKVSWPVERLCRSEEHTSELQSLMRISYAVFCLKKK